MLPRWARRDRERVEAHLRLAEMLGAQIVRLAGPSVARALLEYARDTNVTRIVAGKPRIRAGATSSVEACSIP